MSSSALAARWKLSVYLCGRTAKLVIVEGTLCWWMRGYASNPMQRMEAMKSCSWLSSLTLPFCFTILNILQSRSIRKKAKYWVVRSLRQETIIEIGAVMMDVIGVAPVGVWEASISEKIAAVQKIAIITKKVSCRKSRRRRLYCCRVSTASVNDRTKSNVLIVWPVV